MSDEARRTGIRVALSLGVWLGLVTLLSGTGWLGKMSAYAIPPTALLTMILPAVAFRVSPGLRRAVTEFGLRRLTALHILRVAAVPLFFWYGRRGLLPEAFVNHAGWGDLIAGATALLVVLFWAKPAGFWVAHVVGMVDFLVAFGTAMMLTRANEGAMHAVTGLPIALIPFFAVGVLGSTHLMAYDLLWRGQGWTGMKTLRREMA